MATGPALALPSRPENTNEEALARAVGRLQTALASVTGQTAGQIAQLTQQVSTLATAVAAGRANVGPALSVTATQRATDVLIQWAGVGVTRAINGGAAVAVADNGQEVVTRPASGQPSLSYRYEINGGAQTVDDTVTVLAVDNAVGIPGLDVTPITPTPTQQGFVVSATNPTSGGPAPAITVAYTNCTGTPAAGTVTNGATVQVDRPSIGGSPASVLFTASLAGGGSEAIARTVLPVVQSGPSLDVVPTTSATTVHIVYSGDNVDRSINGAAYVNVADSGTEDVTRPTPGNPTLNYTYRATLAGQTVTETVTIPATNADSDTVTPILTVTPEPPTALVQAFDVSATDPKTGGPAPTITMTLVGCTADVTGGTIPSGQRIVVTRPAFGQGAGTVTFQATLPGGGAETIQRTVAPQQRDTVPLSLSITLTGSTDTTVSFDVYAEDPNHGTYRPTFDVTTPGLAGWTNGGNYAFTTYGLGVHGTATRPAPGAGTGRIAVHSYVAGTPGYGDAYASLDVPAQTVLPAFDVRPRITATTGTTISVVVDVVDPLGRDTATVGYANVGGIPGSITGAGTTSSPYVVPRPAANTSGSVTFTASAAGRVTGSAPLAIPAQNTTEANPYATAVVSVQGTNQFRIDFALGSGYNPAAIGTYASLVWTTGAGLQTWDSPGPITSGQLVSIGVTAYATDQGAGFMQEGVGLALQARISATAIGGTTAAANYWIAGSGSGSPGVLPPP